MTAITASSFLVIRLFLQSFEVVVIQLHYEYFHSVHVSSATADQTLGVNIPATTVLSHTCSFIGAQCRPLSPSCHMHKHRGCVHLYLIKQHDTETRPRASHVSSVSLLGAVSSPLPPPCPKWQLYSWRMQTWRPVAPSYFAAFFLNLRILIARPLRHLFPRCPPTSQPELVDQTSPSKVISTQIENCDNS